MKASQLKIRPELYSLIPRPSIVDYKILKESIKKSGMREPIIVDQHGYIIDGYTRLSICSELKILPKFKTKHFKNYDAEIDYVIETNLHRRHLNTFQRAELFFDAYRNRVELGKHYASKKLKNFGNSAEYFAKKAGVNKEMFSRISYIMDNATDLQLDRLRNGKSHFTTVYLYLKKMKYPDYKTTNKGRKRCPICQRFLPKKMQELADLEQQNIESGGTKS